MFLVYQLQLLDMPLIHDAIWRRHRVEDQAPPEKLLVQGHRCYQIVQSLRLC
jgi:hypothetical protein